MIQVVLRGPIEGPTRAWDAAFQLGALITKQLDVASCHVTVNANRSRVLWWQRRAQGFRVSVHWALLQRPTEVVDVINGVPHAWTNLRDELPPTPPRGRSEGQIHDLEALLQQERELVPDAPAALAITWGRWPSVPPRRTLRLGSYADLWIRVHPALDDASVPAWFVGFIVFHEMLHAVHPPELRGTRRSVHPPRFRRAERQHPHYERALRWERANVAALLARCRARLSSS